MENAIRLLFRGYMTAEPEEGRPGYVASITIHGPHFLPDEAFSELAAWPKVEALIDIPLADTLNAHQCPVLRAQGRICRRDVGRPGWWLCRIDSTGDDDLRVDRCPCCEKEFYE